MTQVPQPVVPVCYRHPGRETYVRCTRCNRPICPDCMRDASVGHQCPECVAEGRRTQRPARTAFGGAGSGQRGSITIALISINAIMLLASLASAGSVTALAGGRQWGGLLGGLTPLLEWGGVIGRCGTGIPGLYQACGVADGEYYRLFTAMFLHFGLLHLAVNMWALWILGRSLEAVLGRWRFLALYLIAGLGGNVAAYVFSPGGLTAGASTALFGLFAALFVVMRKLRQDVSSVIPVLVINLIITLTVPGISIAGHLGGLVVGGAVALGLAYAPPANRTAVQAAVMIGAVFLLGGATIAQTLALTA